MNDDELTDGLARFLCAMDQEGLYPESRETVEQSGHDWHSDARRVIDWLRENTEGTA